MKANKPSAASIMRSRASQSQLLLRIKHPSLDPADITRATSLEPEHSIKAGTDVSATGVRRLFSESYWLAPLASPLPEFLETRKSFDPIKLSPSPLLSKHDLSALRDASGPTDILISVWLRRLSALKEFFTKINQEQGSVTLVLQRADRNTSFTITPALGARLAELGVRLEID